MPDEEVQQVEVCFSDCGDTPDSDSVNGREQSINISNATPELNQEIKTSHEDENSEVKNEKYNAVSFIQLFRYATPSDYLLILLGAVMAIANGAAVPALMLVFGDLAGTFINQEVSATIANPESNSTVECVSLLLNITFDTAFEVLAENIMIGTVNCSAAAFGATFEDILHLCYSSTADCLDNDAFLRMINTQTYTFIGIGVGAFIASYFQILFFQRSCEHQVHKIRLLLFQAILRQNVGWFDTNPSGELSSRLTEDIGSIHDGIGDELSFFIQWSAVFLGGFIVAFIREWRLTLLLLGIVPVVAISGIAAAKISTAFASREQEEYVSAGAVAEEVLSSIKTVVAFGGEYKEAKRYDQKLKQARHFGAKRGFAVGFSTGFALSIVVCFAGTTFWFGGYLISQGIAQPGAILTVFFTATFGTYALKRAAPHLEYVQTAAAVAGNIFGIIERKPLIDAHSREGLTPTNFDSTIEFNNVSFSYPTRREEQVLEDFSLSIKVGQTIALVGPSGCGKSTVIQLLQRFYDVDSGEVFVGGHNIRSLNLKWLRSHIGIVSQEPVLFDTTIAENIRYGKEGVTMREIEDAARNANAHDFISALPDGYNTLVGERGTQLSGGQKQRIAITRALVRDPEILILDEATSALDARSEAVVHSALERAKRGRTTIVIAHRLCTIQSADVIASIRDGCVEELGTHNELMARKGLYYELVTTQVCGAEAEVDDIQELPAHNRRSIHRTERGSSRCKSLLDDIQELPSHNRRSTHRTEHGSSRRKSLHKQTSATSIRSTTQSHGSRRRKSLRKQTSSVSLTSISRASRQHRVSNWSLQSVPSSSDLFLRLNAERQRQEDKDIPAVPLHRVLRLNAKEWWIIILGLIGAAFAGSLWPIVGILFGEIIRTFSLPPEQVLNEVNLWAGLYMVIGLVAGSGIFMQTVCFSISGGRLTTRLRSRSFKAMLRQEMGWHDEERNSTGALTARLAEDARLVQGATGTRLGVLFESFIGILLAVLIAFIYSWLVTFLLFAMIPVIFVAGILTVKGISALNEKSKKAAEMAGKITVDSIDNIQTVAGYGLEERMFREYERNTKIVKKRALRNTWIQGLTYAIAQCITYWVYAAVFRFGAFLVTQDRNSILYDDFQDVFRVFVAVILGGIAAGQVGAFAPNYAEAKQAANRIFTLLDCETNIDGLSEDGNKLENVQGKIAVRGVRFAYPTRNSMVLRGLDLSVSSGQTLALVGPSGCGKSTIVSLIERFYDPLGGGLLLDGTDLKDLNIRWLRSKISMVSQEPVLFDASIADNIRYGANFREVSDEEVIEAAKAANIHNLITSLPKGYDTNVGAKGTQLSGGQKQRIAIARALVRDPKILLLDEATSALDTESEKIVQDALDKAREGRTSIIIAHRLSTIYNADCIAVIKGGKVAELGAHSELLANKSVYYKLNRIVSDKIKH